MEHLTEMCCDSCREQLQAIEQRAYGNGEVTATEVQDVGKALEDRRVLLGMIEQLLRGIASSRQNWRLARDSFTSLAQIANADAATIRALREDLAREQSARDALLAELTGLRARLQRAGSGG